MIIKMTILRFLGSSDDKEKEKKSSSVSSTGRTDAWSTGASDGCRKIRRHGILVQEEIEAKSAYRHRLNRWSKKRASVLWAYCVPETMSSVQEKFLQHRFNRRCIGAYHRCNDVSAQEKILWHRINR